MLKKLDQFCQIKLMIKFYNKNNINIYIYTSYIYKDENFLVKTRVPL